MAEPFLDRGRDRSRRFRGAADHTGQIAFSSRKQRNTMQPAEIMEAVNNDFRSIFGARSFMTAMCVALDPRNRARRAWSAPGIRRCLSQRATARRETIRFVRAAAGFASNRSAIRSRRSRSRPGRRVSSLHRWTCTARSDDEQTHGSRRARLAEMLTLRITERAGACSPTSLEQAMRRIDGKPSPDDVAALAVRRRNDR